MGFFYFFRLPSLHVITAHHSHPTPDSRPDSESQPQPPLIHLARQTNATPRRIVGGDERPLINLIRFPPGWHGCAARRSKDRLETSAPPSAPHPGRFRCSDEHMQPRPRRNAANSQPITQPSSLKKKCNQTLTAQRAFRDKRRSSMRDARETAPRPLSDFYCIFLSDLGTHVYLYVMKYTKKYKK